MNMYRCYVLLFMLLIGGGPAQAQISLSSPTQFDTVLVNTTDSLAFWVRNAGGTPFTVTDINTTRQEFRVKDTSFTVPANDSVRVYVHFGTNQNVTWKDVVLVLGSGLPGALPVRWTGTGRFADPSYNSTQGLWENALKTALTNLVTSHTSLGYNTGRDRMFETVDDHGLHDTIECVYTGRRIRATNRTEAQNQNFDTEHTWPQGTFNQIEPNRSDLNHLFPTYSPANNARGSYPFGVVVSNITYQEGGSKRGLNASGDIAFEPRDVQKGDVARALFYFMLRYQNNYEGYLDQNQENALRLWYKSDTVNSKDRTRNNAVASFQGKRNPLVDHPEFIDRISSFRSSTAPTLSPDILTSTEAINFGTIAVGDSLEWTLFLLNNGRATLSVSGLLLQSPSPNFRIVDTPTSVSVDSFARVRVRFIPTQASQIYNNALVIQSSDPDEATVNVALTGSSSSGSPQITLNTPANSASGVETPVAFTWFRIQSADLYHLQVSLSNTFASFVVNDSSLVDSSIVQSGLSMNTTYYWRVRAHTGAGWGSFSTTRSFTTWTTPAQVISLSPADGATNVSIPSLFTWQSVATAIGYQFDLSTSSSFDTTLMTDSSLIGTSRLVSGLMMNTTYYWRVRARNGAGWGPYSASRSFTTWTIPTQAVAISPADSTGDVPIPTLFVWHSTELATRYQLEVSLSSAFSTVIVSDSSLTDTSRSVSILEPGTTYYWRIRAGNGAGWGAHSETRVLTTWIAPAMTQLVSPADGTRGTGSPPVLVWQQVVDAKVYKLEVSTGSSFASLVLSDSTLVDTMKAVAGLDTLTSYFWRVSAGNGAGWGPASLAWQFRVAETFTLVTQMSSGWNMIALPVEPIDPRATSVFPSATSAAFAYSNGYVSRDTLYQGVGYWMNFGPSHQISVSGEPITSDSVPVNAGWNLIGAISSPVPVSSITTSPSGIVMSPFFEFNNGYSGATTLSPMKAYWVRCTQAGTLILQSVTNIPQD